MAAERKTGVKHAEVATARSFSTSEVGRGWRIRLRPLGSNRCGGPLLHRADLTEKRCRVEIGAPPLCFSVFVVDDEGHWHLHGLVRGRDACEFAALSPRHRAFPDHNVALRNR